MKPAPVEFTMASVGGKAHWCFARVPIPPSTNRLYRNITKANGKRGKALTKQHAAWRKTFLEYIAIDKMPVLKGPWCVEVILPLNFRGDPSNYVKSVEDALVKSGRVPDDRKAEGSCGVRGIQEERYCLIIIRSLPKEERDAA